jgi:ribonuclease G
MREILLNIASKEKRCAHLKNGILHDLVIEREKARQLTGNVYRGKVTNILHNIQSAFIDINEGENGFIHISDIIENTQKFEKVFDMNFDLEYDIEKVDIKKVENADIGQYLKLKQSVLVQVLKEPIGSKGARLTSSISIAGRYLVLLPNTSHRGVSRKIEGRQARDRLKRLIRAFDMPQDMGLICRTESCNATTEMLIDEANDLLQNWLNIIDRFNDTDSPNCLYEESDFIKKSIEQAIKKKYDRFLVDHYGVYQKCKQIASKYADEYPLKIEYFRDNIPMYECFGVERELEKALKSKIWLSSGGYLYFDRTEAMYTIDVNSGRFNHQTDGVEETLVRINLEAAEEIARQLRIRNIGGLIICDFIDMRYRKNQRRVLDKLKDCMKEDSIKCIILNMSDFGLIEMTRQRSRESLEQTMLSVCDYCSGSGRLKSLESMAIEIERTLHKVIAYHQQYGVKLVTHPILNNFLKNEEEKYLDEMAEKMNAQLQLDEDDTLHLNEYQFYSLLSSEQIEI